MTRRHGLGICAILFYIIHAGYWFSHGLPENAWWTCHLGSAAIGAGLLLKRPLWNGVGVLWLGMGNIFWGINLATGGEFEPTSVLTHIGGLAVGLYGVKILGLPRVTWLAALASIALLQRITPRLATPDQNVNLAFRVWPGWEGIFPSYAWYEVFLCFQAGVLFALFQWLLHKFLAGKPPVVK